MRRDDGAGAADESNHSDTWYERPPDWGRASESYSFVSQRLAIRQATVNAGLKTLPTS